MLWSLITTHSEVALIEPMGEHENRDATIKRFVLAPTERAAGSGGRTGARLRRRTVVLRDGVRVTLRPIAADDRQRLLDSFARLSEESRYRRFLASKGGLFESELDYLVDVDHCDHEAIVAIDPSTDELLGVARYVRAADDPEVAEVAITVADDWQGRGLGRALLDRLTYRARREGVRRFSALVQNDNRASLGLLTAFGDTRQVSDAGQSELLIDLPPKRGIGVRLARALRAAAAGALIPAQTMVHRVTRTDEGK